MASIHCAVANAKTVIFESNTAAGIKLLQTGGGRCNFTHLASPDEIVQAFGPKGRFLSYCLHRFSPQQVRQFFRRQGLESKVDHDGCIFPVTERASDVRDVLIKYAKELGVRFYYGKPVKHIVPDANSFAIHTDDKIIYAKKVIIATGGLSWPQTGSTGDGYRFARELGHHIIQPRASLVPLVTHESWPGELSGTSLEDVKISTVIKGKKITASGPMIFTQDGIGGPAVLDLSHALADYLPAKRPIEIFADVVPAMNESKLEEYLISQLSQHSRKIIVNVLFDLISKKLAGFICRQAGVAETTSSHLAKEQRKELIRLLKKLPLSITAARPIEEATVTRGGVSIEQIQAKTMESKICPCLFFAGEVLDVDGPCGGYNLQMCWSTGALAGLSAAEDR